MAVGLIELLQIGEHGYIDRVFRFGGAALILVLRALGPELGPLPFTLLLATIMIAQVVQGPLAPTPMAAQAAAAD